MISGAPVAGVSQNSPRDPDPSVRTARRGIPVFRRPSGRLTVKPAPQTGWTWAAPDLPDDPSIRPAVAAEVKAVRRMALRDNRGAVSPRIRGISDGLTDAVGNGDPVAIPDPEIAEYASGYDAGRARRRLFGDRDLQKTINDMFSARISKREAFVIWTHLLNIPVYRRPSGRLTAMFAAGKPTFWTDDYFSRRWMAPDPSMPPEGRPASARETATASLMSLGGGYRTSPMRLRGIADGLAGAVGNGDVVWVKSIDIGEYASGYDAGWARRMATGRGSAVSDRRVGA